jgi:ABC-type amino acid transport substrate-binding protein
MLTFAGCAKDALPSNDADGDGIPYNSVKDTEGKILVGMSIPGVQEYNNSSATIPTVETIWVDSVNDIIQTLKSGRGDYGITFTPTAKYYASVDSTIGYTEIAPPADGTAEADAFFNISMLTRESDTELLKQLNDAIVALKADGTLDKLNKDYIENPNVASADPIPTINGAKTVKVGIAGDSPPFDYVNAAGKPTGFNVELMKVIAAKCGFNVEFVQIATNAKFAALNSGRTNVHFFTTSLPYDAETGYANTEAYSNNIAFSYIYIKDTTLADN